MFDMTSITTIAKGIFIQERNKCGALRTIMWEDLPQAMKDEYIFLANQQKSNDTP